MAQSHDRSSSSSHGPSGLGIGLMLLVFALILILGPIFAPVNIPNSSRVMISGLGVLILVLSVVVLVVTKLYLKTSADEAFVRTGRGGGKVILDGGALIIPLFHSVVRVSLRSMRLNVPRSGPNALITGDNLRADVDAEFYIRVQKKVEDVNNAATSLGHIATDPAAVEALVFEKLVNALRTVAATKDLRDLHTKRTEFAQAVQDIVSVDLGHNGLTLESVTISKLDQTPKDALRSDDNVFDAQGAQRITEIVTKAKVERSKIEADGARTVKATEVERDRALYEQDVERAKAEAERDRQIAVAKAEANSESAKKAAEQDQIAKVAEVQRDQAVRVAEVTQQQAIQVAEQARQRAVTTAEIERTQATEVADLEKKIAVAKTEKDKADAEADRLAAEEKREAANQAVTTVTVTAQAEREAKTRTIAKRAAAEQLTIEREAEATVAAFKVIKEAEAEQKAAEAKAQARLKQAEADKRAKALEAEGDTAVQMVPVNVATEQVKVEAAKVDVLRSELEAKAQHSAISRDLEIAKAQITANKEVDIARAQALGTALNNAEMKIYGDPTTAARLMQAFTNGQNNGQFLSGLSQTAPDGMQTLTMASLAGAGNLLSRFLENVTGMKIDGAIIEAKVREAMQSEAKDGNGSGRVKVVERPIDTEGGEARS